MVASPVRMQRQHLELVDFCARECALQRSGERSVSRMVQAWTYAVDLHGPLAMYCGRPVQPQPLTERHLFRLGAIVEPEKVGGWRATPVTVNGTTVIGARPEHIERQIVLLVEQQRELPAAEFYRLFEEIHPFVDGNGRVGQILFNYLNGTLGSPTMAPDFWNDPRRATT